MEVDGSTICEPLQEDLQWQVLLFHCQRYRCSTSFENYLTITTYRSGQIQLRVYKIGYNNQGLKKSFIHLELQQISTYLFHCLQGRVAPLGHPVLLSRHPVLLSQYSLLLSLKISHFHPADSVNHLLHLTIQLSLETEHLRTHTHFFDMLGQFLQLLVNFHKTLQYFGIFLGFLPNRGSGSEGLLAGDLVLVWLWQVGPSGKVLFQLAVGPASLEGVGLLLAGSPDPCGFGLGAVAVVVGVVVPLRVESDELKDFYFLFGFPVLVFILLFALLTFQEALFQFEDIYPQLFVFCPELFKCPLQVPVLIPLDPALAANSPNYHLLYYQSTRFRFG